MEAVFLLDQLKNYEKLFYLEEILGECVIWIFLSLNVYAHARSYNLVTFPA